MTQHSSGTTSFDYLLDRLRRCTTLLTNQVYRKVCHTRCNGARTLCPTEVMPHYANASLCPVTSLIRVKVACIAATRLHAKMWHANKMQVATYRKRCCDDRCHLATL